MSTPQLVDLSLATGDLDTARALGGWAGLPWSEDNSLLVAVAELSAGYLTPEPTWLLRQHDGRITRSPAHLLLGPVSWTVVLQRIAAVRQTGLQLASVPSRAV